ncbi:MBL fold metallo-hydrolase [Segetibacter sp. 3557_3]|uniref:MBL fold metallo-hydrolase n=1 Tax=Segetibacter sp. 3557_3 TaxID=2547429 RepID=UPI001058C9B9|nr:MBL fold metallo-hydrolase [Segetibacter sp. 3557_3]TDH29088.1 MBL fold metallo-hydrolase [Segetibacter sp. 3557_3]
MLRRDFMKRTATLTALLPLSGWNKFMTADKLLFMDADVIKIKLGEYNCTIFRDLTFKYLAKDFFINATEAELTQSLLKYRISPDNIPSPFIALLLENKTRKILVDTGIGFLDEPLVFRGTTYAFKGQLEHLLDQQHITGEEITDVVVTHFHPDHIGGISAGDGKLRFPKARFHMHEEEWSYWHSSRADHEPALFRYFIEKNITPLKNGNLNLFRGDNTEIFSGVTALMAAGHTPGQIALNIKSEHGHLLYISDAFLHPLHLEKLDWRTNYDLDHTLAKQTRIKLAELAYKENMLVNAFHFDFPGLGRIDKVKNVFTWKYSEI